jgi:hypothetical protein
VSNEPFYRATFSEFLCLTDFLMLSKLNYFTEAENLTKIEIDEAESINEIT